MKLAKNTSGSSSIRFFKGTTLNLIAVGFNQGSTFVINIIVARTLVFEAFGEYTILYSTLLTISTLSQLAAGYTASKYIAEYRSVDPKRSGRIMGLCSLSSIIMAGLSVLVLFLIAPWLASEMMNAPHLSHNLLVGSVFLFFSVINGYQTGALSGLEAYGGLAKAGILSGIFSTIFISLGAILSGLNGALFGLGASAFFRFIFHYRFLRLESALQNIFPKFKGSYNREKSILFNFSLPAAFSGYYSMPMIWFANSFLVRQPNGYGEMALYSAANNIRLLVLFLPNVMNVVGLSVLNNELHGGNFVRHKYIYRSNVVKIFFISLCGFLTAGLLDHQLLELFGNNFLPGHKILWLLLFSTLFESLSIALYQYLQSLSKLWHSLFLITIPREGCLVIMSFLLVQPYGGVGLATAYFFTAILGTILHIFLVLLIYRKGGN